MDVSVKLPVNSYKWPRLIRKISLGSLLLGGGALLLFHGYCWGWWGRNRLLLQYLFQCNCPLSSNEFRYPESVDVVVPACQYNKISLTPSGNLLFVNSTISEEEKNYILDLRTGEKSFVPILSNKSSHFLEMPFYFLSDTLIFHSYYGVDEYIFDLTNEEKYQIQKFSNLDIDNLAQDLRNANSIFLIDSDAIVVLMHDIKKSFTFDKSNAFLSTENGLEDFLLENQVFYIHLYSYLEYPSEISSFNGKFIARDDGIYLTTPDKKIVDAYDGSFSLYGWVYDSMGAIYAKPFGSCLIRYWFPLMDGSKCLINVPQPILKLKVPQEYLDGTIP